ncbi:MAG: ATP-dependent RNA helicase RhlB, partial [Luteimonas sp.]
YYKQQVFDLRHVQISVLDEADRMFDLGFIADIRYLLRKMPAPENRQSLLFSATLSHRVLELAYEHMNEPEKLVVETESVTAARVRQKLYYPADEEKIPLLIGLLSRSEGARTMVFVNTKAFVERVARALEKAGYRVGVLSGDVPQKKRESLLKKFQAGQLELLVATDVAARGLHIDGVSHVFNYDLPFDAEDYVHRIGRTARLGAEGDAISFACERYAQSLPEIEAYIEQKIPVEPVTSELLTALPRAPREGVASDDEDGDSISEIFKEVREARAVEDAKRGGGRGAGAGGRGAPGARGPRPAGSGEGRGERGPRKPRPPRVEGDETAAAPAVAAAQPVIDAAGSVAQAMPDESRPPRKRRRRRAGKKIEGAEGASTQSGETIAADASKKPQGNGGKGPREVRPTQRPAPASKSDKAPSLLSRIGRGLRRLVSGDDKR